MKNECNKGINGFKDKNIKNEVINEKLNSFKSCNTSFLYSQNFYLYCSITMLNDKKNVENDGKYSLISWISENNNYFS